MKNISEEDNKDIDIVISSFGEEYEENPELYIYSIEVDVPILIWRISFFDGIGDCIFPHTFYIYANGIEKGILFTSLYGYCD